MKAGMAPASTTVLVWSEVPEAMFVRAQAASNWMGGHSENERKLTNVVISPASTIELMGGCFSLDSNFLFGKKTVWRLHIYVYIDKRSVNAAKTVFV